VQKIFCFSIIILLIISCSTIGKNKTTNLDSTEISMRKPAPSFKYESFYKTANISNLKISKDENTVYFLKKDRVDNIYAYSTVTKVITPITKYSEKVNTFLLGPEGKFIYLEKDNGGSEIYDIYRFNLKTKKTRQLTFGKNIKPSYMCSLTKDGSKLFYSQSLKMWGKSEIKELNTKSGQSKTILKSNDTTWYCSDSLSKDENKIGLVRFIHNNEIHAGYLDIKSKKPVIFLNEKNVKNNNLTMHENNIYFLSTRSSNFSRIWKYNTSSKSLSLMPLEYKSDIQEFTFHAAGNSTTVKYRGTLNSKFDVYNGVFKSKRRYKGDFSKYLSHAVFSQSKSVLVKSTSHIPDQYYIQSKQNVELFYDSNTSGIANKYFTMSRSTFIKSFDGTMVPAHFYIPNGTAKNKKKPAIIMIHGGPEQHFDAAYSGISQFWANRGFIVVTPNVRGSTGFGKKYQFMDNGDWGGGHIKDIIATSQFVKNMDIVDRENVFLVGGSFGGFSVMSTITQYPNEFKAAVNIFGPTEFNHFVRSLPTPAQKYFIGELGFDPRKDTLKNKKVSPLYHVENISIPLQIHQGSNDVRVPKRQSDLLVKKIKDRGINVDYVIYPDEGHGFTKFKNSKKCFVSIADFFEKNRHL